MLHKINAPNCRDQLERILHFQGQVLEMVCDPAVNLPLSENHIKQRFTNQDVANWLWRKLWKNSNPRTNEKSDLHQNIEKIILHTKSNTSISQNILDAFTNDTCFEKYLTNLHFRFNFQLLNLHTDTKKAITDLMMGFYDFLDYGFPKCIHQGREENFNRGCFVESFQDANKNLGVCPACDRRRPGLNASQVDHFFPQSKYPFLSVHPFNLVPICSECNATSCKGDKDPIEVNKNDSLLDTFHPYEKPAIENITVFFNRDNNGDPQITISDNYGSSKRVDNLNRIIKLQNRWVHELPQEIEAIRGRIADKEKELKIIDEAKNETTLDNILLILDTELDYYKKNIGKQAYSILSCSYVTYVLFNDQELNELFNQFFIE